MTLSIDRESYRFRCYFILLLLGLTHRALQWGLLRSQVWHLARLNSDFIVWQLLPADLWHEHFVGALLYLQQSPPIPNLIYGLVLTLSASAKAQAAILILFSGVVSCCAGVLLALLLARLLLPLWLSLLVGGIFILNGDILVNEYSAFGQLFYEQLSMLEGLVAALAAVSLTRHRTVASALWLGISVAALALTRASFSYLALPVLLWILWSIEARARFRLAGWFLVPIILLHGGWALKQWAVQKEFLWATSTWGGANIQAGELKRMFAKKAQGDSSFQQDTFVFDVEKAAVPCLNRWEYLWMRPGLGIFGAADAAMPYVSAQFGPSQRAVAVDQNAQRIRGRQIGIDSAAFRELSGCAQRAYLHHWMTHPQTVIKSWWQSYGVFWSPIANFTEVYSPVLLPEHSIWADMKNPPIFTPQGDLFYWPRYSIQNERHRIFFQHDQSNIEHATVLLLPLLPAAFAFFAMVGVHSLPLVGVVGFIRHKSQSKLWPESFSFLVLLYGYLAVLSNLVEYGENMRFRISIEPITWAIALLVIRAVWILLQEKFFPKSN